MLFRSVDGDSIRLVEGKNSIPTMSLCVDESGQIWSGSENRLNLMRNDSIISVHIFNDDAIQGIFTVDKNHLLITTIRGIHFFNIYEYFQEGKLQFLRYDRNSGFTGMNPQINSMFKDSNGVFWLTCNDRLVSFNPKDLIRKVYPPKLHMSEYEVSTDNVNWRSAADFDGNFSHINRNFRFSFIGINYSAVENVRYSYRLRGFQNDWSEPIKSREINFNNLLPGKYVFEIYADAGTDDSRSGISQISFSINRAFWQSWWFFAVVIILLVILGITIALHIQRRKNRRLIEQLETEKQLNELRIKSVRLRSIPHFNANVLSAIEYYIMNLSKEEANQLLSIYSDFTSRTLREMDKPSRSLTGELEYVQLYLKLEKLRFMEKFNYEIYIDPEVNPDVRLPNMILHTYCENAVKHGLSSRKSGGLLKISAYNKGDEVVEVCVEDNGVGRVAAAQNKNVRSTKQGLDILSRQIEIYNRFNKKKIIQRIDDLYDGNIPVGTRFTIEVPYGFCYQ